MWSDDDEVIRRARYQTSVERETLEMPGLDLHIADYLKKEIHTKRAPDNLTHITALAAEKFNGKTYTPPPEEEAFINFQGPTGTYRAWPVGKYVCGCIVEKTTLQGWTGCLK